MHPAIDSCRKNATRIWAAELGTSTRRQRTVSCESAQPDRTDGAGCEASVQDCSLYRPYQLKLETVFTRSGARLPIGGPIVRIVPHNQALTGRLADDGILTEFLIKKGGMMTDCQSALNPRESCILILTYLIFYIFFKPGRPVSAFSPIL